MALTANQKLLRRGPPANGTSFGYYVAAGEQIWGGGIVALNAAGNLQRVQTAGSIAVVGIASRDYNNTANASVSADLVQVERGVWQITVPGATAANIDGNVYATDDATATLGPGPALSATPVAGNALFGIAGSPFAALGIAGSNTGNGTFGSTTIADTAPQGSYLVLFSAATVFAVYKPDGSILKTAGATGTAFKDGGFSFTITAGGTAFVSGDSFVITVAPSGQPLMLGTLSGIDATLSGSPTFVRIKGT